MQCHYQGYASGNLYLNSARPTLTAFQIEELKQKKDQEEEITDEEASTQGKVLIKGKKN